MVCKTNRTTVSFRGLVCREDERTYAWIDKQFRALAGPDGTLDKETFKKALQVKKVRHHHRHNHHHHHHHEILMKRELQIYNRARCAAKENKKMTFRLMQVKEIDNNNKTTITS